MFAMTDMTDRHARSHDLYDLYNHSHERRSSVNDIARLRLIQAQSYRQNDIDAAMFARIMRGARGGDAGSIRVRIGRSFIRLGERLAAEPALRPARPR